MDVACSTLCFTNEPLERALRHIAELEFAKIDLVIADNSPHVTPRDVLDDVNGVLARIRQGPTIGIAAITARMPSHEAGFRERLEAIAHLAKQLSAPILTIDASPTGTPLADEAKRLTELMRAVSIHGAVLAISTRLGTLTESPDVAQQLCEMVPGLALTLDPGPMCAGPHANKSFDALHAFTKHVHLRDTGRDPTEYQVKLGRGAVEFNRIINALERQHYQGSFVVALEEGAPHDFDVEAEVRKLRLMIESLL